MSASTIALGVLAVILTVGGITWLARSGRLEPDSTNEESLEERDEMHSHRESFDIPVRKRIGSWSGPMKVFVLALGAFGVLVAATGYFALKTGSPVKTYVPEWAYMVAVGLFGVGAGVRLKNKFDEEIGRLNVVYERTDGAPKTEQVLFAKDRVGSLEGNPKVPEIAGRWLGLFPRYRMIGEHRELRGGQKPLNDILEHAVPDHGVELPNGDYVVTTREEGEVYMKGATSRADITYRSTNSLSDERAQELRAKNSQMEARVKTLSALNSDLDSQLNKMRKRLENEDYKTRQDLMEDFQQFSDMYSTLNVKIQDQTQNGKASGEEDGESREVGA